MIISLCIPCKNRTHDLKKTMPFIIEAARVSPPIEIMILDYNSDDNLADYANELKNEDLGKDNFISYAKFTGRKTYHIAHAYNLSVRCAVGEVIVILGTDIIISVDYLKFIREAFEKEAVVWACPLDLKGIIAITKKEFNDTGGYDERFEFYGPEDKEFDLRLNRRGGKFKLVPNQMLKEIVTARNDKFANYRPISHPKRKQLMRSILKENSENNVLVVNQKTGWGRWTI